MLVSTESLKLGLSKPHNNGVRVSQLCHVLALALRGDMPFLEVSARCRNERFTSYTKSCNGMNSPNGFQSLPPTKDEEPATLIFIKVLEVKDLVYKS